MDIKAALEDLASSIADDMILAEDSNECETTAYSSLKSALRGVRVLAKAITSPTPPPSPVVGRFRADGKFTTKEEGYVPRQPEPQAVFDGPRMVTCDGGESDGSIAQVDGMMPDGASTLIGGDVYTLTAGRLVYNKSQTERRRERMMGVES